MISRRATFRDEENALGRAVEARRGAGLPVCDLTVSNPTTAGLVPDASVLDALATRASLVYDPAPFGIPSARESIARMLGCEASRVALTASTSEAYAHLLTTFCDPGDHVLVPRPSYPLIEVLAQLSGVAVRHYDLAYDGAWHIDASTLTRGAKLVFAVSPNNPTGSYLSVDDFEALRDLDAPLVVDEVFARYPLEGARAELASEDGLVVTLGGLSKECALPQLKLAWMTFAGDPARVHVAMSALAHVTDAYLGLATPVQHALPTILEHGAALRARVQDRLRANLRVLDEALAGSAVTRLRVEGGFSVVLHLPGLRTESEWVLALLDAGVLTQPGYFYDFAASPRLVLSLLTPEGDFASGIRTLLGEVERAINAA